MLFRKMIYNLQIVQRYLLISAIIVSSALLGQEAWPTTWYPMKDIDWNIISDPNDQSGDYLDFIDDAAGASAYYTSSETSAFFRMVLEGTVINNKNELRQFCWNIMIDVDDDNYPDWTIMVGGVSEILWTFYNTSQDLIPEVENSAFADPISAGVYGYVREADASWATNPTAVYLDIQVPYSALTAVGYSKNITPSKVLKFFLTSSVSESNNVTDAAGAEEDVLSALANAAQTSLESSTFGFAYDTRDTNPASAEGTWKRTETVLVSGIGWPPSSSTYYTSGSRNMKILTPTLTEAWSGTVTTDASGAINAASTWAVDNSAVAGQYTIQVEDPTNTGTYNDYDTFTLIAPIMSVSKSTSTSQAISDGTATYTITISNTGNDSGHITTIVDTLPAGFSYAAGTSSGITAVNPAENSQVLLWSVDTTVAPSDQATLSFSANVSASQSTGTYTNIAAANGSNFDNKSTGATAAVEVVSPELTISKVALSSTVNSGGSVAYVISVINTSTAPYTLSTITDNLPAGFTYSPSTTSGITTSEPTINSQELTWSGLNTVINAAGSADDSVALTFTANVNGTRGEFYNSASADGIVFTGDTAMVQVLAPDIVMSEPTIPSTAVPGDTITYTVPYLNGGENMAVDVVMIETVPTAMTYIQGSASGSGLTITYSHDNGSNYDTSDAAPVTHIKYYRASLASGGSGSFTFKMKVN